MTDPEERAINRAICLLGDEHQDEREEARAALHTLFRDRRRLASRVERLEEELRQRTIRYRAGEGGDGGG